MSEADAARSVTARRVKPGARPDEDFTYSVVVIGAPAGAPAKATRKVTAKPPAEPPAGEGERRADGRMRTRLRDAVLAEERGRVLMDCRIRDKSRHGARLRLDKDLPLPGIFLLKDPATGTCYRATLVWQAGHDAGVRLAAGK